MTSAFRVTRNKHATAINRCSRVAISKTRSSQPCLNGIASGLAIFNMVHHDRDDIIHEQFLLDWIMSFGSDMDLTARNTALSHPSSGRLDFIYARVADDECSLNPRFNDLEWTSVIDAFLEQAAAPQPPQIIPNESATTSTGSLIDVDSQSVRTVPSDFLEQDVQTSTQQERLEREAEAAELREKAAIKKEKEKAKAKAHKADNWLASKISSLSDNQATAVVFANLAAVVGVSAVLGVKGWRLHERGTLTWTNIGVGAAILGVVGIVERGVSQYVFPIFVLYTRVWY